MENKEEIKRKCTSNRFGLLDFGRDYSEMIIKNIQGFKRPAIMNHFWSGEFKLL
jgi:hypothetical protein